MNCFHSPNADMNGRLLVQLMNEFEARDIGSISNFFAVEAYWRCPCCYRSKSEIARLDKNDNLLCSLVMHHDHFVDYVGEHIDLRNLNDHGVPAAIYQSLVRFPETLICGDCNVAEPVAKRHASAPDRFSFTPYEIAGFIIVTPNAPHEVDPERAREAYAAAQPAMKALADRLRAVARSENGDTWEPIAHSAMRVLHSVRRSMKDAAE